METVARKYFRIGKLTVSSSEIFEVMWSSRFITLQLNILLKTNTLTAASGNFKSIKMLFHFGSISRTN